MQELVISILLTVVIIMAAALLIFVGSRKDGMTKKQRVMMARILISAGILLALQFISAEMFDAIDEYLFPSAGRWLRFACYLIDYLIIGYDILRKAAKGIKNRQVFDESFLMAVATIGAMALAIYENGEYLEAIAVMLFYQIGEALPCMKWNCPGHSWQLQEPEPVSTISRSKNVRSRALSCLIHPVQTQTA